MNTGSTTGGSYAPVPHSHPCSACGHCPTCGRSNTAPQFIPVPYQPYQLYPHPYPYGPYRYQPGMGQATQITSGSTATTNNPFSA